MKIKFLTSVLLAGMLLAECKKPGTDINAPKVVTPEQNDTGNGTQPTNSDNNKGSSDKGKDNKPGNNQNGNQGGDRNGNQSGDRNGNQSGEPAKPGADNNNPGNGTASETVKKPSDYNMAERCNIEWKQSNSFLELDAEPLLLDGNKKAYNIYGLSKMLNFRSSSADGTIYSFTEEDLANTSLTDIRIENNKLFIRIRYKNHTSGKDISIDFNLNEYYSAKIQVNQDFVGKNYMRGIAENMSGYLRSIFEYDGNKYSLDFADYETGNIKPDDNANSITYEVIVSKRIGGEKIASISGTITGFKNLTKIKNDMAIHSTAALEEYFTEKIKKYPVSGGNYTGLFSRTISSWISKVSLYDTENRQTYKFEENEIKGRHGHLDLLLKNPKWELKSAIKENNVLRLIIKLAEANDVVLDGVEFNVEVNVG